MSLSKIVDNREIKRKEKLECLKNKPSCMFYYNGECTAEWCIFEELPKIITEEKTITCSICNTNTAVVSVYSGITDNYICPDCRDKIHKLITNPTCDICGAGVNVGKSVCSTCAARIRGKLNE